MDTPIARARPSSRKPLESAVRADRRVEVLGQRLVEQVEVHRVQPELAGAHVEGMEGSVVAVIGDPYLRLDEQLGPIDAACGDRGANLGLVEVRGGGVDHPVPERQGFLDRGLGFARRGLEDAEAERGQLDAVVEANRPPVCRVQLANLA